MNSRGTGNFATAAAAFALIAAGWAAYCGTFSAPFFFDDIPGIVENASIRDLRALGTVLSPPSANGSGVGGRPLVNLSLAINYALGGTGVSGYHALNLAIHLLASLALFGVVRRTLARTRGDARAPLLPGGPADPATCAAFAVALLWSLHPLLTESVTCVIQRTESMMGLFYLLTLYCFARGAESTRSGLWATLSVSACLCGMATKETMVTAPVIVLLYDRTFLSGTFRAAWRARRRVYLALAGTWLLLAALIVHAGGSRGASAGFGLGITPWTYALTQCRAIPHYLRLSFWPHPLIVDYGSGVVTRLADVAPQAVLVLGLLVASTYALFRPGSGSHTGFGECGAGNPSAPELHPRTGMAPVFNLRALGFLGASFFIILSPSSSFVPLVTQTIAEHRMYLPLAAVLAAVVCGGWSLAMRANRGSLFLASIMAVSLVFGSMTVRRNRAYHTVLSIWSDTVVHQPDNARARTDLGNAYLQVPDLQQAIACYREGLKIDPRMPDAHYNLGVALVRSGQTQSGADELKRSLELNPNAWVTEQAHYNLATALVKLHRLPEAIEHLEQALALRPDHTEARTNLATALFESGRANEAFVQYQRALATDSGSSTAHFNFANLLAQRGRFEEASSHYRRAIEIDPSYAKAHCNLGGALAQLGRFREAEAEFREALRLNPAMAEARDNLARVEAFVQNRR